MATTTPSSSSTNNNNKNNTNNTIVASTDAPVSTSASLVGSLRRAREYFAPVRAKSAFLSKGVLTPDEFVKAGDELVHRCPTWTWESGDPSKHKPFLPVNKQFLITRGVPSTARVDSIEQALVLTTLHDDDGDDDDGNGNDDWLVSSIAAAPATAPKNGQQQQQLEDTIAIEDEFDILDINEDGEVVVETKTTTTTATKKKEEDDSNTPSPAAATASATTTSVPLSSVEDYPDDEEYADMADFEDDNILVDDDADAAAAAAQGNTPTAETMTTAGGGGGIGGPGMSGGKTVPTRRYDISITYDKYYQTPRVWMTGFNEHQQPLSVEELMEDVVSDYRHKVSYS